MNNQCKPKISKLSFSMAWIWPPPRSLWCVSNVHPSTDSRTRDNNSRCTKSASRTAGKPSNKSANNSQPKISSWTSFWHTWESPDSFPNEMIPATCETADTRYHRDCGLTSIAGDFLWWLWCGWWERRLVGLGLFRSQPTNPPKAYQTRLEVICQPDGAGQLQCVQQVEESIGGCVSGEEASVYFLGAEPVEATLRWTPCTGRWRLQSVWRHSQTGCHLVISIMMNGFGGIWLNCIWRNLQAQFWRQGKREAEATSDRWQIGASTCARNQEVTSPSCQIQCSGF